MSESNFTNFVISISSYSGGGKSTLVRKTAELLDNATTLYFDDYANKSRKAYPRDIKKWFKDGADINEFKTPNFAKDVRALRNGENIVSVLDGTTISPTEFIVIEDPTGRARYEMKEIIDFVVLIDTPLEVSLVRRLLRDIDHMINISKFPPEGMIKATKEKLAQSYTGLINYLKSYLNSFLNPWREIYIEIQSQVEVNCDIILDGLLPADELAKELTKVVRNKRKK